LKESSKKEKKNKRGKEKKGGGLLCYPVGFSESMDLLVLNGAFKKTWGEEMAGGLNGVAARPIFLSTNFDKA